MIETRNNTLHYKTLLAIGRLLCSFLARSGIEPSSLLLLKPVSLCLCVCVSGTPTGRSATSDRSSLSQRHTTMQKSMSKAFATVNALLTDCSHLHCADDGTFPLWVDHLVSVRRWRFADKVLKTDLFPMII